VDWIKRYIYFHDKHRPKEMGALEVGDFLTHLAVAGKVCASTQNQVKSALLFLYRKVLEVKLQWLDNVTQAKTPKRLPVVLTVSVAPSKRTKSVKVPPVSTPSKILRGFMATEAGIFGCLCHHMQRIIRPLPALVVVGWRFPPSMNIHSKNCDYD
jgi:hypothetical protein